MPEAILTLRVDDEGNVLLELPPPGARGVDVKVRRRGNWAQINVTAPEGRRLEVKSARKEKA